LLLDHKHVRSEQHFFVNNLAINDALVGLCS